MIQRREAPWWLGSSPVGRPNLVARTTPSRRPLSAFPTTTSDSPYVSEVSRKLIPASSAWWMMRTESSWSALPTDVASARAPSAQGVTLMPALPRVRYRMRTPGLRPGVRGALRGCRIIDLSGTHFRNYTERLSGNQARRCDDGGHGGARNQPGRAGGPWRIRARAPPAARRRAAQQRLPGGGGEGRLRRVRRGRARQGDS